MDKVQAFSIIVTAGMFGIVFELVRRKRLLERYALLWMFAAALMLGLAAWRGALEELSSVVGIAYAPSALFAIAFAFVLVMLLHFSLVLSRLSDENKVLAQRIGLLQQRMDAMRAEQHALEHDEAPAP